MNFIRISRLNSFRELEEQLDRVAEKHGFEPRLRTMVAPQDLFDAAIGFDLGGGEYEEEE